MGRTKVNKPVDAIICGDLHIREDQPICRTDDYWAAQWKKMDFIAELQYKYNCKVLCSGDMFEYWKPSPFLLSHTIAHLPDQFYTVYGNHDLPQHNLELAEKSGVYTLAQAGKLTILPQCHWGKFPDDSLNNREKILVWHVSTYQSGHSPYPGCTWDDSMRLLRKYSQYDLIITGHNHMTFTAERNGKLLINPGSMTRHKADQMNHTPCVFLYHAEDNTCTKIHLPFDTNVINREHIEKQEKRDNRIDAFIVSLTNDWKAAVSFEENLERFKEVNQVRQSVMDIIYESIEKTV